MIRQVVIRRFKRFDEVTFDLNGHVVLAGPNNCGKTTMLQAIAAFSLALREWKTLNSFRRGGRGGNYSKKAIARQAFAAVPLRSFDLLWSNRKYDQPIEIGVTLTNAQSLVMELDPDSSEQIYVRPKAVVEPAMAEMFKLETTFIPPMTGLETEEPVYRRPKQDDLLGKGKSGDVLRNLLVSAHESQTAWPELVSAIKRLFGYDLLPPNSAGAHIIAEYRSSVGIQLDIASAGSGFQQVLMLLAFLYARPASVLLLDEPDAHLHVLLQDAIYQELRTVAAKKNSQLVVATHSEVVINSVAPEELSMFVGTKPRPLKDEAERTRLADAMRVLTNMDMMLAAAAPGVLFTEGYTDFDILREWVRVLNHPIAERWNDILCKRTVTQHREDSDGIRAQDYYDKLKLVREDLPAIELLDGDNNPNLKATPITGNGLQRAKWTRYEIESYLFHPAALRRFVESQVGPGAAGQANAALDKYLAESQPPAFLADPFQDLPFLIGTKARKDLLPPALEAAGLPALPYTRYHEIAAMMLPEEIHPEVKEKLDAIQQAFNL